MVTPVETVKTKLIHMNMDFIAGVKHIIAKEGLTGVYQGLGATIMKQVRHGGAGVYIQCQPLLGRRMYVGAQQKAKCAHP